MRELERKLQIAEMKCEERNLKYKIFRSYLPFQLTLKFNKLIVLLSIVAIISYTVAAILLQKYTMTELSPTLTTCVYGFLARSYWAWLELKFLILSISKLKVM